MTKHARTVVGIALTALFLWLALRNVDLAAVGDALRSARYGFLVPAAACTLAGFALRAVRWQRILAPTADVPARRLFPIMMVGFATNNVLPARVGELARAYLAGSKAGVSRSSALATIVVERVCDGLTLIALMTATLAFAPLPTDEPALRAIVLVATLVFGLGTAGLAGMLLWPTLFLRVGRLVATRLPGRLETRVDGLLDAFLQGLGALRDLRAIAGIVGLSIGVWSLEWATYAFVLQAFSLGLSTVEWLAATTFLLVFVNLGIMLPSAPGYIGTYQFFAKLALNAFGVASASALGLAIVAHAMQYAIITSLGLLGLIRLGLTPTSWARLAPALQPVERRPAKEHH